MFNIYYINYAKAFKISKLIDNKMLDTITKRKDKSCLIGSPRGYICSNKGELTEKISKSELRVILIDEFEKADKVA